MTKSLKYFGVALVGILIGITAFGFYFTAAANPLGFSQGAKSATATTSVSYMTPGTGTTTVLYDSYEVNGTNQTNNGNTWVPNSITVLTQIIGSTTASLVNAQVEYSMDKQDWFKLAPIGATSTEIVYINDEAVSFQLGALGDRDAGLGGVASSTRRAFTLDVPTRYVRLVFTVPIGNVNSSVWAQIIPKKEAR